MRVLLCAHSGFCGGVWIYSLRVCVCIAVAVAVAVAQD